MPQIQGIIVLCLVVIGSCSNECRAWERQVVEETGFGVVVFTKQVGTYPDCPKTCFKHPSCSMFTFNATTPICTGLSEFATQAMPGVTSQLTDYYAAVGRKVYTVDFTRNISFAVYTTKKNWVDAKKACTADGGGLISLSHVNKINIRSHIGTGVYWVGLSDIAVEGSWVWENGDAMAAGAWSSDFNDYDSSAPNPHKGSADCAVWRLPGNDLIDQNCVYASRNFICEKNM